MVTADKPLANNNMTRYAFVCIYIVYIVYIEYDQVYVVVDVVDANIAINDFFLMFC